MDNRVYLDIDIDYYVKPIQKNSVNGVRLYKDDTCKIESMEPFFEKLKDRVNIPAEKHIFTNHKKSYIYWWMKRWENNTVIHIDAHSDLYRNKQKDLRLLSDTEMNCDDYLWYAVRDGFINEIYWVYPQGAIDINDRQTALRMFGPSLVSDIDIEGNVLNITLNVISRMGKEKKVKLHILGIDDLPYFDDNAVMLTVATSPEFIPSEADVLIDQINSIIGFNSDNILSVKRQHESMLYVPEEDIQKARNMLDNMNI